jgi:PBSX family phage terminase large subunit
MMNKHISEVLLPSFKSFWLASKNDDILRIVCKGGRGSGKSYHIALRLILDAMKYPISILCVRKVERTLEGSVFEQLRDAIEVLGVSAHWKVSKSPLKLTYTPRGNSIIFRGADDPAKIKSIKMSRFPIARLWVEEIAEFKSEDEVRTIVNSIVRDELKKGITYKLFYSYNPPKRRNHWVNKLYDTRLGQPNTFIHHSTYINNTYISQASRDEAESLRERNEALYRWEYLGEPIGNGIVPFNNLTFRDITDEEVEQFDNLRAGVDWGYSVDPFSYVLWHYDKTRRTIYAIAEAYGVKMSNREAFEQIQAIGHADVRIIADSAEPKSIDEMRMLGLKIMGAIKGKGSIEYGEKWLDDLDEIVIDPRRTPNIAREFEEIDYKVDMQGNTIAKLEEKNNHTIDSTRYALSQDMRLSVTPKPVELEDEDGNPTKEKLYRNNVQSIVGSGIDRNFFKGGI